MMVRYFLRVEAVNFNYFIYDTDKIQPMRGGSYVLLKSINNLADKTINGIRLNKIMTGASIGLFSFELENEDKAKIIAAEVRGILCVETGGHATFVISVLKATGNFERDNETITAMNRWQQFQQPTLILPKKESDDKCFYDGVRPGFNDNTPEGKKPLSESVLFRRDEGKKLRKYIYKRILGNDKLDVEFTDDLEELSEDKNKGNLNGKMALIYFDGNKFTKIRTALCKNESSFSAFSQTIEESRKGFLSALIAKAEKENDFKNSNAIRLETLLWGGDEFEIVVPAWKGWEVLRLFFECMGNTNFNNINLTHGGSIIFSHHKAPIRQIRSMARKLAEIAKQRLPSGFGCLNHNDHNVACYLIMESFDTIGPDVKLFVNQYYGNGFYSDFILTPPKTGEIKEALDLMKKNGFPRNKIFEMIKIIKSNLPTNNQKRAIEDVLNKALSDVSENDKVSKVIDQVIDKKYHRWLMLADLWDYVGG